MRCRWRQTGQTDEWARHHIISHQRLRLRVGQKSAKSIGRQIAKPGLYCMRGCARWTRFACIEQADNVGLKRLALIIAVTSDPVEQTEHKELSTTTIRCRSRDTGHAQSTFWPWKTCLCIKFLQLTKCECCTFHTTTVIILSCWATYCSWLGACDLHFFRLEYSS